MHRPQCKTVVRLRLLRFLESFSFVLISRRLPAALGCFPSPRGCWRLLLLLDPVFLVIFHSYRRWAGSRRRISEWLVEDCQLCESVKALKMCLTFHFTAGLWSSQRATLRCVAQTNQTCDFLFYLTPHVRCVRAQTQALTNDEAAAAVWFDSSALPKPSLLDLLHWLKQSPSERRLWTSLSFRPAVLVSLIIRMSF